MTKLILGLFFCVTFIWPAQTGKYTEIADLAPVPTYKVKSTRDNLTIDGRLSELAWRDAAPITLRFPWEDQLGIKQRTRVKLLRDDDYLYIGYECDDVDITAIHERRDAPTYEDDCVEIFLKPSEATDHYFGLEMNARGVLFDYRYYFPERNDRAFNLDGVLLKTFIRGTLNQSGDKDHGWTLEVAIPWASLKPLAEHVPPQDGESWRAQINRWDGTDAKGRRLSMWTHSGMKKPTPHNPERFGYFLFK